MKNVNGNASPSMIKSLLLNSARRISDLMESQQGAGEISLEYLYSNIINSRYEFIYPTSTMPIELAEISLYKDIQTVSLSAYGFMKGDPIVKMDDNDTIQCMEVKLSTSDNSTSNSIYYIDLRISWKCNVEAMKIVSFSILLGSVI